MLMLKNWMRFGLALAATVLGNVGLPAQAVGPSRVCPPIKQYLPTDEPQFSRTFVERLSSGFYIDWTGWLKTTASELEPAIHSIVDCDIIRSAMLKPAPDTILKADLTLRKDGRVVNVIIDGKHCYARSKQKVLDSLRLPAFPIGSELSSITVRFDLTQHQLTVVPQARQMAGSSTIH